MKALVLLVLRLSIDEVQQLSDLLRLSIGEVEKKCSDFLMLLYPEIS